MNRPLLRRTLAYAGSALVGLASAVIMASPAQAHHTTITAKARCTPSEWVITWTVENWDTRMSAKIDVVDDKSSPDTPITNIVDGATLPGRTKSGTGGKLLGEQRAPLDTTSADLTIAGRWTNGNTATNSGHIQLDRSECGNYKADLLGQAVCDAETGNWIVSWSAVNKHYTDTATVKIVNNPNDLKHSALRIDGVWAPLADKSVVVGIADGDSIAGGATREATQKVPGNATAARLKVLLNWAGRETGDTQSREVTFEGSCVANAPRPSVTFSSDCTGVVTVTLINAADATKPATFVVAGAGGWTSGEIVVQAGEDPVRVTVPKAAATKITVQEGGDALPDGEYTPREGNCPSPSPSAPAPAPSPSGSPEPGLPVTGANGTVLVTTGLLLVAIGLLVFMLARRRRLNLTDV